MGTKYTNNPYPSRSVPRRLAITGAAPSQRKESPMVVQMVEQLRNVDVDRTQAEDAIALLAFGKLLRAEFERVNYTAPSWLDDKIRLLTRYIEMNRRDTLELRLKQAKAAASQLLTPTERRSKVEAEIAELEKQLSETK
jgi:hypothetical protein